MVVCEQHRDGVPDEYVTVIPPLEGETDLETLDRKLAGAQQHGWQVELLPAIAGFHAWKQYADGRDTIDRPYRKDRYFRIELL